ncbi:hypothetical protein EBB07_20945 [Paenibacillaceae bacterium]|nr:hypothetical protein EBB07_20945 [Paenibacillaceae bacterium]
MRSKWRAAVAAAVVFSMLAAASGAGSNAGSATAAPDSRDAASSDGAHSTESADSAGVTGQEGSASNDEAAESETTQEAVDQAEPTELSTAVESSAGTGAAEQAAATIEQSMELAAENEILALYYHPKTTEIAVKNKRDGSVWFSNPQDREEDSRASGINKSMLSSQLLLTFSDKSGKPQQYNNFNQSVKYEQFEYEKLDDGIRITYTIGEKLRGVEQIPQYISEDRFQTLILDNIQDEKRKEDLLKRFRLDPDKKVYERRDSALNGMVLTRTLDTLAEAGYNEEEMNVDREAYAGGGEASQALFVLPVTYRLEGDQFIANVSTESIDDNGFYLQALTVLPYFGAAGTKQQGYMFVPDGSGSIIRLNNGKLDAFPYNEAMYSTDAARLGKFKVMSGSPARLPVFGMKKDEAAFVAIIEDGDAIGRVEADVSGRANSYNYVYSSYEINGSEPLALTGSWTTQTVPKFQAKPYLGDITVRYGFLQGEDASYSGMASYYRSYLIDKHGLTTLEQREQIPFYVELIGGIPKKKFFLGIPYNSYQALTTFSEAQEILEQLQAGGMNNIKVRYTGWFNGGVKHEIPSSVSVDNKLGGKSGLAKLLAYTSDKGIDLYPDVSFLRVLQEGGRFSPKKDASRTMNGSLVAIHPYNLAGHFKELWEKPSYALSPAKLPGVIDKFVDKYGKLGMNGLSLRDLGEELNSDYNTKHVITREDAKRTVEEQLAKLDQYSHVMVSGGNAYTLPYVDSVVNVPLGNSGYNLTDQSVPFYEMVLHGYIDYAGPALNLSDEQSVRYNTLKSLETGANLYFTWFYAKSSLVKGTEFDYLYSAQYRDWIDEAKKAYDEVSAVLSSVRTQVIKDHQMLEKGVYQTAYEDGTTVVVNYNDYAVNVGGAAVDSMGYLIGGERN